MPDEPTYLLDHDGARRIVDAVRWAEGEGCQSTLPTERWKPRGNRGGFVWARVSAAAVLSTNRWTYTCVQQDMTDTGWTDTTNGYTYTPCYNGCEANNDGTGVQGNGVDIDGEDFPAGMSLQPIRGDCVVQLWPGFVTSAGVQTWRFFATNAIDGTCLA